jgi:hypothetical protein
MEPLVNDIVPIRSFAIPQCETVWVTVAADLANIAEPASFWLSVSCVQPRRLCLGYRRSRGCGNKLSDLRSQRLLLNLYV